MALVYIADDEPNIRKLVAFGLRDAGYESAEFADGTSLLAAVRQKRPDAVILDWMMPPPDGLAVCRILRESPEGKHLPILMLTAKGEEFDRVLGLEIGADDYVVKPFSMKELAARVRAVPRRAGCRGRGTYRRRTDSGYRTPHGDQKRRAARADGEGV